MQHGAQPTKKNRIGFDSPRLKYQRHMYKRYMYKRHMQKKSADINISAERPGYVLYFDKISRSPTRKQEDIRLKSAYTPLFYAFHL